MTIIDFQSNFFLLSNTKTPSPNQRTTFLLYSPTTKKKVPSTINFCKTRNCNRSSSLIANLFMKKKLHMATSQIIYLSLRYLKNLLNATKGLPTIALNQYWRVSNVFFFNLMIHLVDFSQNLWNLIKIKRKR